MENLETFLISNNYSYKKDYSVKEFLSIRIGGKAALIITVYKSEKLIKLIKELGKNNTPFILLGGGSNTLFPDKYIDIPVIINKTSKIVKESEKILKVNSGISNSSFLKFCKENCIDGFEFLSGIPGTIGGAVAVNAGAFGKSISDYLIKGEILTFNGDFTFYDKEDFKFSYRNSVFKFGKDVILNVFLEYTIGDCLEIKNKIGDILNERISKHPPYSDLSAGCFFKNPLVDGEKISAGKLIEDAQLKGHTEKNLKISEYHSNFLINMGNSSFSEVRIIEKKIKKFVKDKSGITLEREVIFISPEGEKY